MQLFSSQKSKESLEKKTETASNLVRILKLIVLILELLVEAILTLGMFAVGCGENGGTGIDITALMRGIFFLCCAVITIGSFVRLRKEQKFVIITGFGMKIVLFIISLCVLSLPFSGSLTVLFFGGVIGVIITVIIMVNKHINKTKEKSANLHLQEVTNRYTFFSYKAKWAWDDAAKEFCTLRNKSLEQLTDEENGIIYKYACSPIAYLLVWVIKHNYYNEEFVNNNILSEIEKIKNEQECPTDFVSDSLDCVVTRDDFAEGILPFIDYYYTCDEPRCRGDSVELPRTENSIGFFDDYYAVVGKPNKMFYCIDFSWKLYHELEKRIDKAYSYYNIYFGEADILYNFSLFRQHIPEHLSPFCSVEVYAADGVSKEYENKCVNHFCHMTESLKKKITDNLFNHFSDQIYETAQAKDIDIEQYKIHILNLLEDGDIHVNLPHGEEPAYTLGFEAEFEEEHGVGIVIRGDQVVSVSYRVDVTSPWCRTNDITYRMLLEAEKLNLTTITTVSKANTECNKGSLAAVKLVPEELRSVASEQCPAIIYLLPLAAELKAKYDTAVERMLYDGSVDYYECQPNYAQDSLVPQRLRISAKKENKLKFFVSIEIWNSKNET